MSQRQKDLSAHADEDGHCTRCGLPFEDPAEITHECPPGYAPVAATNELEALVQAYARACVTAGVMDYICISAEQESTRAALLAGIERYKDEARAKIVGELHLANAHTQRQADRIATLESQLRKAKAESERLTDRIAENAANWVREAEVAQLRYEALKLQLAEAKAENEELKIALGKHPSPFPEHYAGVQRECRVVRDQLHTAKAQLAELSQRLQWHSVSEGLPTDADTANRWYLVDDGSGDPEVEGGSFVNEFKWWLGPLPPLPAKEGEK